MELGKTFLGEKTRSQEGKARMAMAMAMVFFFFEGLKMRGICFMANS
jgi:hypothetical protein